MSGERRHPPNPPGLHLLNGAHAAELVRSADVRRGELVVDLGAGTGALTRPLVRTGARVLAVERDPRLAGMLRRRFTGVDTVRVVERDLRTLHPPRQPYRVLANPPFSLAMTALGLLLDDPTAALRRADLIVPWPLAVRLTRATGVGPRARRWRRRYAFSIGRRLDPTVFRPPPSVSAGVLVIRRLR